MKNKKEGVAGAYDSWALGGGKYLSKMQRQDTMVINGTMVPEKEDGNWPRKDND